MNGAMNQMLNTLRKHAGAAALAAFCVSTAAFAPSVAAAQPAPRQSLDQVVSALRGISTLRADFVQTDLATLDGVDRLLAATQGRRVDYLLANAGHGLGRAFLDQDFDECRHVIDTNITGTIYLIQQIELPRTLSIGRFNLKVQIKDLGNNAEAEVIIPISIVAQ